MGKAGQSTQTFAALPLRARGFLCATSVLALAAPVLAGAAGPPLDALLLVVLIGLCAFAAAFETYGPGHYALQPSFAFFFWGALLLPVWAIAVLALACFVASARRAAPHKTAFNLANYVLSGVAASATFAALGDGDAALHAMVAAAIAGTVVNHVLLLGMVGLAAGRLPRHQVAESAPLSFAVALTGACLAVLWLQSPALVALGLGPLALLVRALDVPMLRHRANTEPKTGLLHFDAFKAEWAAVEEAARRGRSPVTVAMIDLDHLRAINNRRGHLAGDIVIRGLADALREICPPDGHAARFGGEEFCLLLPGMEPAGAAQLLAELRDRLRAADLREAPDAPELRVTFSAGIAAFPEHGSTLSELLAAADEAAYDAKAAGRDRIRVARTTFTPIRVTRRRGSGRVPAAHTVDS